MTVRDFIYMLEGETDGNALLALEQVIFVTQDGHEFAPIAASGDGETLIVNINQGELPEPSSIYDLFEQVRQHPDFVFGTIFVREDFPGSNVPADFSGRLASDMLAERGNLLIGDHATYCEDCGVAIVPDPAGSQGVWVHDPNLGDEAYDLNEAHAARPPEGTE